MAHYYFISANTADARKLPKPHRMPSYVIFTSNVDRGILNYYALVRLSLGINILFQLSCRSDL